jgi:hypothetical protein
MSPTTPRISAARRNAEAVLNKKPGQSFSQEQEREREALRQKSARLRELRLAKEEAEREAATQPGPSAPTLRRKVRRAKQN